jgi:hypothetical protein
MVIPVGAVKVMTGVAPLELVLITLTGSAVVFTVIAPLVSATLMIPVAFTLHILTLVESVTVKLLTPAVPAAPILPKDAVLPWVVMVKFELAAVNVITLPQPAPEAAFTPVDPSRVT